MCYNKDGDYMYLKIKNKKIPIKDYNNFKDRLKSLRMILEPIDYGIKITNAKIASTYFFCQRVDICFTDKNDIIIKLYENVKTEKRKINLKAHNIYYLPLNTCKYLSIGTKLKIKEK